MGARGPALGGGEGSICLEPSRARRRGENIRGEKKEEAWVAERRAAFASRSPRAPAPSPLGSPGRALAHCPGLLGHTHASPETGVPHTPGKPRRKSEGKGTGNFARGRDASERPPTSFRSWYSPLGPGQPIPEEVGGGGGASDTC
ncbi:hypothetical protein P7K49_030828 [Saguinus oedipus]|uniref:Uncharacterized protein n=1 Tax=Saguinus oedipus TaxID=9490 RepID=A0ABQ9U3B3_SAGOE|nr:hypothetical protein P7K49_030828 [Saguinus oedipus]